MRFVALSLALRCTVVALFLAGGVAFGQSPAGASRPPTAKEILLGYRADRLIVKPRPAARKAGALRAAAASLRAALGVNVVREHPALGELQVLGVAGGNLAGKIAALRASGHYEYVEPDWIVRASVLPNDPRLATGELWGLNNTGQDGGTNDADIDAPEAWDIRHAAPNVIVAVIDTGVRYSHEDIAANMWRNPGESGGGKETNGLDDDGNGWVDDVFGIDTVNGDGDPFDDNSHGTHCAGTIAGVGDNGVGVTGVAWQAQVMACKFLSAAGSGSTSDAITCIDYARVKGAHILSNSWGGGGYSQALKDAITAARAAGIIFVAAAGNASSDNDTVVNYPSNYEEDNVVAVASTTRTDALSSFSNFGFGFVDLSAPGSAILSLGIGSDSDYATKSGTSMATPHVSGALALLKAQFPADNYRQLINRLLRGVNPLAGLAGQVQTGGRLNLAGALSSTLNTPFNDNFAQAPIGTANTLEIRGSNVGATREAGEPVHAGDATNGATIWWRWTAPASGTVTVETSDSSFDTLLGVYAGTNVTALTQIAANDDAGGGLTTSAVAFTANGGVTYAIAVAGKGGVSGLVRLHVTAPPANDQFSNAVELTGVPSGGHGSNRGGTKEAGEPNHAGNSGGHSVWWKWIAPDAQSYTADSSGSGFDTLLAVYTGSSVNALTLVAQNDDANPDGTSRVEFTSSPGVTYYFAVDGKNGASGSIALEVAGRPPNDSFTSATTLGGAASGTNVGASKETDEPFHGGNAGGKSVWWTWTAPATGSYEIVTNGSNFDTLLGVYTGNAVNALTTIASDDDGGDGLDSRVVISAAGGAVFRIAVDGYGGDDGSIALAVSLQTAPANDHFANRANLFSVTTGSNVGGSKEPGEPNHAGNSGGKSVWWKWTAPTSGPWAISTAGSNFDTILGVYTGAAVNALTFVASDDNSGPGGSGSRVIFTATAGTTYQIAVDGAFGASGGVSLSVSVPAPSNDYFDDRLALSGASTTGTNVNASKEAGEPFHGGDAGGASVWWTWTPAITRTCTIDTNGSDFDTTLGIYTGSSVDALTYVAGDDDGGEGTNSRATFLATAGVVYQIAVDGYSGDAGSIALHINRTPVAVADDFVNVAPGTPTVLDVLANDLDADGNALIITNVGSVPVDAEVVFDGSTITFTGGTSLVGSGVNVFTYTLSDELGAFATSVVTVYRSRIYQWRAEHFGGAAGNGAVSGDLVDPNGNGVVNLVEYALGRDPAGLSTGLALLPETSRNYDTGRLEIRFLRHLDRTDLNLSVVGADSPSGPWEILASSVGGDVFMPSGSGSTALETGVDATRAVTVSDRYPINHPAHPRRFLRLEITRP
jgi:subtilisin family serine protease